MTKFRGIVAGYNQISDGLGRSGVQLVIHAMPWDLPEDPLKLLPFYWSGAVVEVTIDKWDGKEPDGNNGEEGRSGE